jgi:hypothetical protein
VKKEATFNFDVSREGIEARLDEMGQKLERLRGLYESFFMGIERSPPDVLRRELNRQILEMQQLPINNASLRFRYHALTQRWVLLITYWNRTLREIEAGTFSRDLAKAKRRMAQKGISTISLAEALAMGIPANRAKAFVAHQQAAQERNAAATRARDGATSATPALITEPPALAEAAGAKSAPRAPQVTGGPSGEPPPIPLPGLSEAEMQDVYRRYVQAHQKAGRTEPAPSMSKLRERLAKQIPLILSANNCSHVRLEIAAEDGKVHLRAWPVTEK